MKRIAALAVVLALAWATPAFPDAECVQDMAEVDAALAKNPKVSPDVLARIKKYRATGERQDKAGRTKECLLTMDKAKKLLGI